jgi:hypothetical protein
MGKAVDMAIDHQKKIEKEETPAADKINVEEKQKRLLRRQSQ